MPSATKFGGGGFLRNVDGTILNLTFDNTNHEGKVVKPTKSEKTGQPFQTLNAHLTIREDGKEELTTRCLFVGNALDYEFEGATVTGSKAFGRNTDWDTFLGSVAETDFDLASFPEDPEGLVADYTPLIGARFHFDWRVNEKKTKKLGRVKSKDKKDAKGKPLEYDREDLIVTAYYGQEEIDEPVATPARKASTKASVKTTTVAVSKPNGKAKQAEEAVDIPALAISKIVDAVNGTKDKTITKQKLSVKILTALSKVDADVREEVRTWAFDDSNLAGLSEYGIVYDSAEETLSLEA